MLTSVVFQFCIFYFAFFVSAYWQLHCFSSVYFTLRLPSVHISICNISVLYVSLFCSCLCILASTLFQFFIFYFAFLISAYWHLQYFRSPYFPLLSSSLHIDISSVLVLQILPCFPRLCISTSAVYQFCIFRLAFHVSENWDLQYFSSAHFTLLCLSLHIDLCSISVLYISPCLPPLPILPLQYFSYVNFTLLSSSLHIDICSISFLYILLCFPFSCILASSVFQFCIFHFSFLFSSYLHLHYFSSVYFPLFSSSLHIGICSISALYTTLCLPRLCILTSTVFQFCIFHLAFHVSE